MLIVPAGVKVHLALGYTDMRKGMDRLAMPVQTLKKDPFSGPSVRLPWQEGVDAEDPVLGRQACSPSGSTRAASAGGYCRRSCPNVTPLPHRGRPIPRPRFKRIASVPDLPAKRGRYPRGLFPRHSGNGPDAALTCSLCCSFSPSASFGMVCPTSKNIAEKPEVEKPDHGLEASPAGAVAS